MHHTPVFYQNDIGIYIRTQLNLDISSATIKRFIFKRPDETIFIKDAEFETNGTDGKLQYITMDGDLDTVGLWSFQTYIEINNKKRYTTLNKFYVKETLVPIVSISCSPNPASINQAVQFHATTGGNTTGQTHKWDFKDGNTSALLNPTHTYTIAGTYNPTFTVTEKNGKSSSLTINNLIINTTSQSPIVSIGSNLNLAVGASHQFTGIINNGQAPFTYAWTFGNGDTGNTNPIDYTFNTEGAFTVSLTITDNLNRQASASLVANVTLSPTVNIGPDITINAGSITLTGTLSHGQSPFTYSWDLGDSNHSASNPVTHTYGAGTYTATLTVTDALNRQTSDSLIITANSTAFSVDIGNDITTYINSSTSFNGVITGGQPPFTYDWNFRDGTSDSHSNPTSHTFTNIAINTVILTITDSLNNQASDTKQVNVTDVPQQGVLVHKEDLEYLGAARIPNFYDGLGGFSFSATKIAYNIANHSLFMQARSNTSGHDQSLVCEMAIPTLVNTSNITSLNMATFIQHWSNRTDTLLNLPHEVTSTNGVFVGGMIVANNQIICTDCTVYDLGQTLSHFIIDSLNLTTCNILGCYQVGTHGFERLVAGYMTAIPQEWQPQLGAPYLCGQSNQSIIATTSSGPAAFGFDPSTFADNFTAPIIPYLYYTTDNPLAPYTGPTNLIQSGNNSIAGCIFIPNTNTILYFTNAGTNYEGYGIAQEFNGISGGTGPQSINGEYIFQFLAYDANDFVAVKNGIKQPWEIRPYCAWSADLPINGGPTSQVFYPTGGMTFDPINNIIYISIPMQDAGLQDTNAYLPIIHAFKVHTPIGGTLNPQITAVSATSTATYVTPRLNQSLLVPGPIPIGQTVTLTASSVFARTTGATITNVAFYIGGTFVGNGTQGTGAYVNQWTYITQTNNLLAGNHTVTAIATDSNNNTSNTVSYILKIIQQAPVVTISGPSSGTVGAPLTFTGNVLNGTGPICRLWYYQDGGPPDGTGSRDNQYTTVTHTFNAPGTYNIGVLVWDSNGTTTSGFHSVSIS